LETQARVGSFEIVARGLGGAFRVLTALLFDEATAYEVQTGMDVR
jgi:hypothetical protein